ncbi:hypothetical protein JW948_11385 [bacterium]|nr:hypothetical protein [bacterium]
MQTIDVIATTISGSISDWKKVEKIVPLFREHGFNDVRLHEVNSHAAARETACKVIAGGGRIPISAGGSGTFRAVLEGCMDAGVPLQDIRLGFLRKGSADLIGKILNMPDEIGAAVRVFAESIRSDSTLKADVLMAECPYSEERPRHFIGYGGAELFGRIPYFTENRYMKYYKGLFGQLFGDLGPFTTGMMLALIEKIIKLPVTRKRHWKIVADGQVMLENRYHALIVVNGYLGPELPFSDQPLDSGSFQVFGLKHIGFRRLIAQARRARDGSIMKDPVRWGLDSAHVNETLELVPDTENPFPVNVDGSTFMARKTMIFRRVAKIPLLKAAEKQH